MAVFFIQLFIPFLLFFFQFPKKKNFAWLFPLVVVLTEIGLFVLDAPVLFLPQPWNYYCYYLICYAIIVLYSLSFFDLSVFNALYFCVFALVVQNFAHHLCQFFLHWITFFSGFQFPELGWETFLAYFVTYGIVYTVFYFAFLRDGRLKKLSNVSSVTVLLLSSAFIVVMIFLGIFIKHTEDTFLSNEPIAIVYETYSVMLDIFLLGLFIGLFRSSKLEDDAHELERRLEQEAKYYEMAQANMELINIKCHDLKHHISALKSMNDSEERNSEIEELKNTVMFYDNYAKTGNDALDCVLTEKGLYCNKMNVQFTYMADGGGLKKMRYMDIYALFGNALDNAIENVLKIPDPDRRIVGLKVFQKGGLVNIQVENYCEQKPTMIGDLPLTDKADKVNHGFGIKSIRYIAHKYGGHFTINVTDKTFCLLVTLPVE